MKKSMKQYPDFEKSNILVVGDVMLDRYFWGDVGRISPEAPVPVIRVKGKTSTLGGAGNVALNLAGLQCNTVLVGVCGNDSPGEYLMDLLQETGIRNRMIKSPYRPTTTKTRVIGRGQQLIRMDEEQTDDIDKKIYTEILKEIEQTLPAVNAVIISDYGKGIFGGGLAGHIVHECKRKHIPVFVDPKGASWDRYKGATCITPNTAEFKLIAPMIENDDSVLEREAIKTIEMFDLSCLLITRGAKGMSLVAANEPAVNIMSEAREVYDVSGAGDTVIATVAASYAGGLSLFEAAELANMAAGIVVGKVGTQPITNTELKTIYSGIGVGRSNKRLALRQAAEIKSKWRSEGKKIVFTNGCFDILHLGHIKLLHAAADEGDILIVGLNSDASVQRLKGPERPVMKGSERAAILSSIECVDLVILFEEDTPIDMIKTLKPDIIVKGGDYIPETVVGHEIVKQYGGDVVIVPLVEGFSTTKVIESMNKDRDMRK